MTTKRCFKCERVLAVGEFYAHPRMADGRLNKCKACTRYDAEARRRVLLSTDPLWVLQERERQRKKQARYRAEGRAVVLSGKKRREVNRRYLERNPDKSRARTVALRAHPLAQCCEVCGAPNAQRHHPAYNRPDLVEWLCAMHHAERHAQQRDHQAVSKFIFL